MNFCHAVHSSANPGTSNTAASSMPTRARLRADQPRATAIRKLTLASSRKSTLSATGLGALLVNIGCALLLARYRHASGSLTRAAFLSARNDAFANIAIVAAGLLTLHWVSAWPDLVVGLAIAALNADAAKSVWRAARDEHAAVARA